MSGLGRGSRKRGGSHRACSLLHTVNQVHRRVRRRLRRHAIGYRRHRSGRRGRTHTRNDGGDRTAGMPGPDPDHQTPDTFSESWSNSLNDNGHRPHRALRQRAPEPRSEGGARRQRHGQAAPSARRTDQRMSPGRESNDVLGTHSTAKLGALSHDGVHDTNAQPTPPSRRWRENDSLYENRRGSPSCCSRLCCIDGGVLAEAIDTSRSRAHLERGPGDHLPRGDACSRNVVGVDTIRGRRGRVCCGCRARTDCATSCT